MEELAKMIKSGGGERSSRSYFNERRYLRDGGNMNNIRTRLSVEHSGKGDNFEIGQQGVQSDV